MFFHLFLMFFALSGIERAGLEPASLTSFFGEEASE